MKHLSLVLALLVTAYEGLAFSILWGWFIAPTFGLPELGFWIALGIIFTVHVSILRTPHIALMHYQLNVLTEKEVFELELTKVVVGALAVTLALIIGFLIHLIA